jgi:uncharacterized membrane protein
VKETADESGRGNASLILSLAIVVLSLVGLWDAFYFTFAYYGRVRKARWVPAILCAREGSNCLTVVQTPYARVFGVPNSLLGIFFYFPVIAWVVFATLMEAEANPAGLHLMAAFGELLIAAAAFAVLLGLYLIYSLIAKLHIHCPLCYTAHTINAALLVLISILDWQLARLHFG